MTKSPEIVALLHIATLDRPNAGIFVIFDSHPRPEHPLGAAFTVCRNSMQAVTYLSNLFRVDASILDNEDNQWQTLFLSRFDSHILRGRDTTDTDQVRAMYAANIRLLRAKEQLKEAAIRDVEIQGKLSHVKRALEEQRRARREASAAEADAERRVQELRDDLNAARELAQSIGSASVHTPFAREEHQHFTAYVADPQITPPADPQVPRRTPPTSPQAPKRTPSAKPVRGDI